MPIPFRIAHLTKYLPSSAGGIEKVTRMMSEAAIRLGASVEIFGVQSKKKVCSYSIPSHTLKSSIYFRNTPLTIGYLKTKIHWQDSDILHLHLPNPSAELSVLPYLNKKHPFKLIPIFHSGVSHWPWIGDMWEKNIHRKILLASDKILIGSSELLNCFRFLKEFEEKISVLPFPTEEGKEVETKKSCSFIKILALGRLVPYKGFDLLIEALSKINLPYKLYLVGEGPLKEKLKNQVFQLKLQQKIKFLGLVSEAKKRKWLEECDLVVVPSYSLSESYGLVIAEAFAFRKPVITTDLPTGVAFLSRKGECGGLVEPKNVEDLKTALNRLLKNPVLRMQAGTRNFQFWKKNLSPDLFESRYRFLVHSMMSTH